jgi:hypothetical protein
MPGSIPSGISLEIFSFLWFHRTSKSSFREIYLEYAKLLDNAKSQDEIEQLRNRFLTEAKANCS